MERLWLVLCYVLALISACVATGAESLPFWTEKSTYVEGDRVYAVGISRPLKDVAVARQEAYDRASLELMNMLQVSDLGKVTLNTQRTFEVAKGEGVQVYRLVWVTADDAHGIKESSGRLTRETLLRQTEQLNHLRDELYPVMQQRQAAAKSLQDLERQANEVADANEYRREQVRGAAGAIERKISSRSRLICELKRSMTEDEVKALVGEPEAVYGGHKVRKWRYGHSYVHFTREGKISSLTFEPNTCDQGAQ